LPDSFVMETGSTAQISHTSETDDTSAQSGTVAQSSVGTTTMLTTKLAAIELVSHQQAQILSLFLRSMQEQALGPMSSST
jgi:hypothetical protein